MDAYITRLQGSINHAVSIMLRGQLTDSDHETDGGNDTTHPGVVQEHVYQIVLVNGTPFYGYCPRSKFFLKVCFHCLHGITPLYNMRCLTAHNILLVVLFLGIFVDILVQARFGTASSRLASDGRCYGACISDLRVSYPISFTILY